VTQKKWAVFISGRGSNLQSIIDYCDCDLALVVSNRISAYGLLRAKINGISIYVTESKIDWISLNSVLMHHRITDIFLAGYMKIIPESFLKNWEGRILNVHPSLLPEFAGKDSLERSFEMLRPMGVTVHEVIPEMDAGPVIFQKRIEDESYFLNLKTKDPLSLENAKILMAKTELRLVTEAVDRWNLRRI
jgi:phosphoribosylglycinamide formyltransferase 1